METKKINQNQITIVLAILYFVILTWIILFKMQFSLEHLKATRNINLVPFGQCAVVNGKIDFDEIMDNIIIFIPAGLYMAMLKKDWKIGAKIGVVAEISLTFEILQYILAIGATDITDLIGNTFGGILGLGVWKILCLIWKEEKTKRILNTLSLIGTVFVILFLLLLLVMN